MVPPKVAGERVKMRKIIFSLLAVLFLMSGTALGATTCLNQTSTGNPYSCSSGGNCTWWAWKMARENWGDPLLKWGDAKLWADGARKANYTVDTTPTVGAVAVNTTVYSAAAGYITGHVAYVVKVDGDYVYVSEMNYGSGTINYAKQYRKTWFQWYIHSKPRPVITSISPNPRFWSWGDISYMVYGRNLSYNERVKICWPSGGCTVLSGAQVPSSDPYFFMMLVTIGQQGMWSITAINNDNRESVPYLFYIW
jgi:surface antigen